MVDHRPASFIYVCDHLRRRIRVTAREALNESELVAIIDRQIADGGWSFGLLYDLRRITGATTKDDAYAVSDYVRKQVTALGPRGPVAIVTRGTDMVGVGQIYAFDVVRSSHVEVFWDLLDAEEWLDLRAIRPY